MDKLEMELAKKKKELDPEEDINVYGQAFLIESKASKNINYVNPNASLIVKKGILKEGDPFICGDSYGKIRHIHDDRGEIVKEAFPGKAVEIAGFKNIPQSGNILTVLSDIKVAEKLIEEKRKLKEYLDAQVKLNLGKGFKVGKLHRRERHLLMRKGDKEALKKKIEWVLQSGNEKNADIDENLLREEYFLEGINKKKIIIRADTIGMLESIEDELLRLFDEKILTNIILDSSVAPLTEDDFKVIFKFNFKFAQNSNSTLFLFNSEQDVGGYSDAYKVGIRKHKLIYNIVEEIRYFILESMLQDPSPENELIKGRGMIKEVFKIKLNSKKNNKFNTINIK
jgi:translation initiation factor IF-2